MDLINLIIAQKFHKVKLTVDQVICCFLFFIFDFSFKIIYFLFGNEGTNLRTLQKPIGLHTNNFMNMGLNPLTYQSASVVSSDLDSTSLFETESEITLDRDMTGK
jgi:hypothetical protein